MIRAAPILASTTAAAAPIIVRPQTPQQQTVTSAVLVTTPDGKTILAHPTGQLLQQIRPNVPTTVTTSNVRLRSINVAPTVVAAAARPQQGPQVRPLQQVCFVQGQRPVFRLPTSTTTSTVVFDANQLSTLLVKKPFLRKFRTSFFELCGISL